ncbi:hypothetical protein [Bdellovibrio sp. HCB337]|uniref:hypothetical protein n=1 Tax=Bdellovibrio sp. HCB337 TaxID=3394358 RepID=UPI0039A50C49
MKTVFKTTLLATSLVLALTACSSKSESEKAKQIHANNQMKSDELADAGEQLVSPYTFMLSDKVFDMALEKDPSNKKAQFYKGFVKRLMVFKGIARRITPLVSKDPKQKADHERWQKQFPESPLKTFLMDGPADIHTNSQLAKVLSDYTGALNDFRKFLKMNPTLELTLNLNPHIFEKEINEEAARSCTWKDGVDGAIDVTCETGTIAQKRINSADIIALRQITGGEMLYWSIFTAYDFSTLEQISKNESLKNMTPPEALAYYKTLPSIAKLNANNTLQLIPELGIDTSAAVKWAKQYQDRVCPKGVDSPNQRRGYLFKDGLCVDTSDASEKSLAMLDQVLGGVFTQPIKDEQDNEIDKIRVNLVGFLKNPPKDLKNILPESVDQDGQVTRWSDNTFGGLFPDGDISKIPQKKKN